MISPYNGGINKLKNTRLPFIEYSHNADDPASLISDHVYYMFENPYSGLGVSKGEIWVLTNLGFCFFDPKSEKFSRKFKFRNLLDTASVIGFNEADDLWPIDSQDL